MNRNRDTLSLIRSSFPGRDQLVERVFRDHPSFRDLCEDYRECLEAIHRWREEASAEAPHRRREYHELLEELKQEIETWLESRDTRSLDSTVSTQ